MHKNKRRKQNKQLTLVSLSFPVYRHLNSGNKNGSARLDLSSLFRFAPSSHSPSHYHSYLLFLLLLLQICFSCSPSSSSRGGVEESSILSCLLSQTHRSLMLVIRSKRQGKKETDRSITEEKDERTWEKTKKRERENKKERRRKGFPKKRKRTRERWREGMRVSISSFSLPTLANPWSPVSLSNTIR